MRLELIARRRSAPALTALVDVVFILLFFFMLAARPAPPRALELRVAVGAADAAGAAAVPQALVRAGGRIELGGRALAADALARELPGGELALRADAGADLQDLVGALDALRRAGIAVQLRP